MSALQPLTLGDWILIGTCLEGFLYGKVICSITIEIYAKAVHYTQEYILAYLPCILNTDPRKNVQTRQKISFFMLCVLSMCYLLVKLPQMCHYNL
jgi:hypothetical protein